MIGQALWFAVLSGLAFLLLIPLAGPLVALGGHTPRLQELETTYLSILCFSALPTLVVLDNFEQVLAAAPVVTDLLGAASAFKVLVTSRAPLHVSGEHELAVPPLELP